MSTYGTHRSFWFNELGPLTVTTHLAGEQRADVVVIGGGYAGLSAAINLREMDPSIDVVLLESEHIGFGASGRNSGYVWPNVTTFGYVRRLFGLPRTRELHGYAARACDYVATLIERHAMRSEYRKPGAVFAAAGHRYVDEMRRHLAFQREIAGDRGYQELGREEVLESIGAPILDAGYFDPDVAYIQPAMHAREMARLAASIGVRIHEMSPAIDISCAPGGVLVTTPAGRLRAERVVLATNAYTHTLGGMQSLGVHRQQYPGFVHSEVSERLSREQWERIGWRSPAGLVAFGAVNHFMHRTGDDRIHWGCDVYFDIPTPAQMNLDYHAGYSGVMAQHLDQYFPALAPVRPVQQWGGPVAITIDGLPHIGFAGSERVLLVAGCNGNGVSMAHLNGRTAAELVLGRSSENTSAWFVRRKPWKWPGAAAACLGLRAFTWSLRSSAARRLADSPVRFHPPYAPPAPPAP